jgi:Uma2 family endonuclease
MSVQPKPRFTPAEYLESERAAPTKSEFYGGEIFAMAGASEEHNIIVVNLAVSLAPQLRGRSCRTFVNDMRVKMVDAPVFYTYPDVVIVCGERQFEDASVDTLLNPTVLIEVLSPSTEGYDRGNKFAFYRRLPSLQNYVLVAQDRPQVEVYERQPDGRQWLLSEANDLSESLPLPAAGCVLRLADVYENVVFSPAAAPQSESDDATRSR